MNATLVRLQPVRPVTALAGRLRRPGVALARRRASGQALAEGLLGLAALGIVFWAVPLIGRYQDIALASAQGSAHAAFLLTREDFTDVDLAGVVAPAFTGPQGSRWSDAAGRALLVAPAQVSQRRRALDEAAQPGGASARALRQGWSLQDEGMRIVSVSAQAHDRTRPGGNALRLARATVLLTDAGHAATPADVQSRLATQGPGWRAAQAASAGLTRTISTRAELVDAGWRRPRAGTDWLSAWADLVPADRMSGGGR